MATSAWSIRTLRTWSAQRAVLAAYCRSITPDAPAADGTVAMTLDLIEEPPRSVGIGAGYNTNIGLGARTFWEDCNLLLRRG